MILDILGLIFIGIVIGVLARLVLPGRQAIGFLRTVLLGIAGAVIGGLIASLIGVGQVFELNVLGVILAVIVAVVLLGAAERGGLLHDDRRQELERRPR